MVGVCVHFNLRSTLKTNHASPHTPPLAAHTNTPLSSRLNSGTGAASAVAGGARRGSSARRAIRGAERTAGAPPDQRNSEFTGLKITNPDGVEVWSNAEVVFFHVTLAKIGVDRAENEPDVEV